jgi:hypothetical protein
MAASLAARSIGAFGGGKPPPAFRALGIEFASQNKLNDLGCETVVFPCVRGLQNLSSLIKGASRLAVGNHLE